MDRKEGMPLWVFLGLSSINTRKGAFILFWSCMICGIAFIPWVIVFPEIKFIPAAYQLDDWSWAALTFPIALWYWLCIKWIDKHSSW